jgi:catechol 2,3-dioxygenase-like lactoylglutathione lyase family enzyme
MQIKLSSVLVDNQAKALQFYTDILGFVKKMDIPMGEARWLTVVSPQEPDGTQLVLEPDWNPTLKEVVQAYKKTLVQHGVPFTAFQVEAIQEEYERLKKLGVRFTKAPTPMGPVTLAVFDDTCGNLIQIYQV